MSWPNTYKMGSIQSRTAKKDYRTKPDNSQQEKKYYPNQFDSKKARDYFPTKQYQREEKKIYQDESKPKTYQKDINTKADKIINKCLWQNEIFSYQCEKQNWRAIHEAHYDWWAFPIDERSSYGDEYMVSKSEIQIMKQQSRFMEALQSNAFIVCRAWGWNLDTGQKIHTDHKDQRWQNWPIRLYKMVRSLEIFGLIKPFKNAVKYGVQIMKSGKHLHYGKRDISAYLQSKWTLVKVDSSEISSIKQSQIKCQGNQKRSQSLVPKNLLEKGHSMPMEGKKFNHNKLDLFKVCFK